MLDGNIYTLVSLALGTVAVAIIIFYLIPKQLMEVLQPRDWLTRLRWRILALLVLITLMALPSLVYQSFRYAGYDYEILRNISAITGRLGYLGLVYVLILIFNYKRKNQ